VISLTETNLLEQCVVCGLVLRDDRTGFRLQKPHAHWMPTGNKYKGEATVLWNDSQGEIPFHMDIHATICVEHLSDHWWPAFFEAREIMFDANPQYVSELSSDPRPSMNCSLSDLLPRLGFHNYRLIELTSFYDRMVAATLKSRFFDLK
jgi:hypothetical protein